MGGFHAYNLGSQRSASEAEPSISGSVGQVTGSDRALLPKVLDARKIKSYLEFTRSLSGFV